MVDDLKNKISSGISSFAGIVSLVLSTRRCLKWYIFGVKGGLVDNSVDCGAGIDEGVVVGGAAAQN